MANNPIIIKDNKRGFGIDVGWRIFYEDGYIDQMWGNTSDDDSLAQLLNDIELRYGKHEIIDERKSYLTFANRVIY